MQNANKSFQQDINKNYRFFLGIYLSFLAAALIAALIFAPLSAGMQQALLAIAVILMLASLNIIQQVLSPDPQDYSFDQFNQTIVGENSVSKSNLRESIIDHNKTSVSGNTITNAFPAPDNQTVIKNTVRLPDSPETELPGMEEIILQALESESLTVTVINTIAQLPDSPETELPGIKELLIQLQAYIESDSNLAEEDKADALEQVKVLAEAGLMPDEARERTLIARSLKILKGTSLESANLLEASNELLPAVARCLNL